MGMHNVHAARARVGPWVPVALCAGLALGWAVEQLVPNGSDASGALGPSWLPLAAAAVAAVGVRHPRSSGIEPRVRRAVAWTGLLLLVWVANGLLFDLLTLAGLIGHRAADGTMVMSVVYWPGLATRTVALAAAIVTARILLARQPRAASTGPTAWYGYAAFGLALPYPVLRLHWALGGSIGLGRPGAAGNGFEPLLLAIPWLLAAAVSLLLASPRRWMPRRLLLAAGWSATAIVATIGPSACWSVIVAMAGGASTDAQGIETWVFAVIYGSWFLWAIAGAAATRSYKVGTAQRPRVVGAERFERSTS